MVSVKVGRQGAAQGRGQPHRPVRGVVDPGPGGEHRARHEDHSVEVRLADHGAVDQVLHAGGPHSLRYLNLLPLIGILLFKLLLDFLQYCIYFCLEMNIQIIYFTLCPRRRCKHNSGQTGHYLSHQSNSGGVSSELPHVLLHPVEGRHLVQQTEVADMTLRHGGGVRVEEPCNIHTPARGDVSCVALTEHSQAVVEGDHNDPAEGGEDPGVVEVGGAPGPGVAVDEDEDGQL